MQPSSHLAIPVRLVVGMPARGGTGRHREFSSSHNVNVVAWNVHRLSSRSAAILLRD